MTTTKLDHNLSNPEPVVRKVRCGWLATTKANHAYRIGVPGGTEDEARAAFAVAVAGWAELHRRAEEAGWL